jgi:hypothetical protein
VALGVRVAVTLALVVTVGGSKGLVLCVGVALFVALMVLFGEGLAFWLTVAVFLMGSGRIVALPARVAVGVLEGREVAVAVFLGRAVFVAVTVLESLLVAVALI